MDEWINKLKKGRWAKHFPTKGRKGFADKTGTVGVVYSSRKPKFKHLRNNVGVRINRICALNVLVGSLPHDFSLILVGVDKKESMAVFRIWKHSIPTRFVNGIWFLIAPLSK